MSAAAAVGVLWADCAHCGAPFEQPRRRGRPSVTCSDECRAARGRRGDVRVDHSTHGTGFVGLDWQERHNGERPADVVLYDLLGEPDSDAQGWGVAFCIEPETGVTRDYWSREQAKQVTTPEKRYGLPGGLDVGQTSPGVGRTLGSESLPWDWSERLDAARGWLA